MVFAGVVAARVNVQETWHQYADVGTSGGTTLQSKQQGAAQILWRKHPQAIGPQWAVVRIGNKSNAQVRTGILNNDLYSRQTIVDVQPVSNSQDIPSIVNAWNLFNLAANAGEMVAFYWDDFLRYWIISQVQHISLYVVESLKLNSAAYGGSSSACDCQTLIAMRRKVQVAYCESESQLESFTVGQVCGCSSYTSGSGSLTDMMLIEMPE